MNLRTPSLLLFAALAGAAALTAVHGDEPLTERVVRSETRKALPAVAGELEGQPLEVRLAFLDYAGDDELVLNARLALRRHPQAAARVLALYGPAEPFREILREYGPAVVPPIDYFLHHEPGTLRLRAMLDTDPLPSPAADADSPDIGHDGTLPPELRGAHAIEFIRAEGHDFLGQFVVGPDGEVARVQTERVATGVKRFFTSGLTNVETKWRRGDDITASDYGWATVDILVPVAIFRVARAGSLATRSVRSARVGTQVSRGSLQLGRTGRLVAAGGALAGVGYVAMNPGMLNSIGAGIAGALGLPPWLVSGALWFLLLLPLLLLLRLGQRWLLRPAYGALTLGIACLGWLRTRLDRGTAFSPPAGAPMVSDDAERDARQTGASPPEAVARSRPRKEGLHGADQG